MYRMLDLAYYTPNLVAVAQANGVQAIGGYVFDPFVLDSGGYVGGWTPQVIGEIEAAGIAFIPIMTMQPASGLVLTVQRCLEVLQLVPRNTNLVAIDVESGSDPGQQYANSWAVAMEAGGFTPILYGSQTTIQSSYVAAGEMKWVASYIRTAWDDSLNPLPGADGWQFAGSIDLGSGVTADLSNATFPIGASSVAFTDEFNAMVSGIQGIGGQPNAGAAYFAALLDAARSTYNWSAEADNVVKSIKTELDVIQGAINATGGHPADTPILTAVANVQAALDAMTAKVAKAGQALV